MGRYMEGRRMHIYCNDYYGKELEIIITMGDFLRVRMVEDDEEIADHLLTREEAIEAARAILKYFNCGMED